MASIDQAASPKSNVTTPNLSMKNIIQSDIKEPPSLVALNLSKTGLTGKYKKLNRYSKWIGNNMYGIEE